MREVVAQVRTQAGEKTMIFFQLENVKERENVLDLVHLLMAAGDLPQGIDFLTSVERGLEGQLVMSCPTAMRPHILFGRIAKHLSLKVCQERMETALYRDFRMKFAVDGLRVRTQGKS
jgi:hypothetical protein